MFAGSANWKHARGEDGLQAGTPLVAAPEANRMDQAHWFRFNISPPLDPHIYFCLHYQRLLAFSGLDVAGISRGRLGGLGVVILVVWLFVYLAFCFFDHFYFGWIIFIRLLLMDVYYGKRNFTIIHTYTRAYCDLSSFVSPLSIYITSPSTPLSTCSFSSFTFLLLLLLRSCVWTGRICGCGGLGAVPNFVEDIPAVGVKGIWKWGLWIDRWTIWCGDWGWRDEGVFAGTVMPVVGPDIVISLPLSDWLRAGK